MDISRFLCYTYYIKTALCLRDYVSKNKQSTRGVSMSKGNVLETVDDFSEVGVEDGSQFDPGKIIILRSGPPDQVVALTREFNARFPRHVERMSFLSIRNPMASLREYCKSSKRLMIVTPHLPSDRLCAA